MFLRECVHHPKITGISYDKIGPGLAYSAFYVY